MTLSMPNNISIKVNGIKLRSDSVENISDIIIFLEYKNRNKNSEMIHTFSRNRKLQIGKFFDIFLKNLSDFFINIC